MFPEMKAAKVKCKYCQHCNPIKGYGSICALKPTNDKRYIKGYIKVYPNKEHYCNKFIKS